MPSQYESQATKTAPPPDANPASGLENFVVEAFLPNSHADPSKVMGGQYMSVDSRPVSHEKGTMKKIVTMFKKYIQNLLHDIDGKIKSPFIRLNIRCPIASYDANIEPTKDEVLFGNEDRLLDAVESLFKAVYGECRTLAAVSAPSLHANVLNNISSRLLPNTRGAHYEHESTLEIASPEDRPAEVRPISSGDIELIEEKNTTINGIQSNMPSKWGFDMSEDLTIEVEGNDTRQGIYQHSCSMQAHAAKQIQSRQEHQHNPWTIAKKSCATASEFALASRNAQCFPTQITDANIPMLEPPRLRTLSPKSNRPQRPRTSSRYSGSEFSGGPQLPINTEHDLSATDRDRALQLTKENDFITARSIVPESLISPPPTQLSKPLSNTKLLRPFRPPLLHTHDRALSDGLHQTRNVTVRRLSPTRIDDPQAMSGNAELVWAMDFEKRKEEAMRRHREALKASRSITTDPSTSKNSRSSPHKNRYNSAAASLTESQSTPYNISNETNEMRFQTCLSHDDPRAYLMGRRRSTASEVSTIGGLPKLERTKSAKLPLETVPSEDQLQDLIQRLPVGHDLLPKVATILKNYDSPPVESTGLPIELADIQILTQRLQAVVAAKMKDADCAEMEIEAIFDKMVFRSMN
jgi:DNA mismatch repair ATPase MutL